MSLTHKYIIANWKMQLLNKQSVRLARDLTDRYQERDELEVVLCPAFTSLAAVGEVIEDSGFKLGAQDIFYYEKGPYTGGISAPQVKELGVQYVIVGHSERRKYMGEDDGDVNRKIDACLNNSLVPIMCVGETFEERNNGETELVLMRQITRGLEDIKLEKNQKLIIAYEPIWAISPASAASPNEAREAMRAIRHLLLDFFEPAIIKQNIPIIYGGSVEADNVNDFVTDDIAKGVLVGNASLKADSLVKILDKIE